MKKWILPIIIVLCAAIFIIGYTNNKEPRPDTNLEFWICDNVETVDFSDYQKKFGLMGGREYYGSGYIPTTNENGEQIDPEHCVIYTVTSYPDYSSGKSHITKITITDPAVELFGLTLNSSKNDIHSTMENNGFKLKGYYEYEKGKVHIRFTDNCIMISVDVSNFFGIQF